MWDFTKYELRDLFRIRDALDMLSHYELHNEIMLQEVKAELNTREEGQDGR